MAHQFHITFSDGARLTLTVDMAVTPPTFVASNRTAAARHDAEYRAWVDKVVFPEVWRMATPAQRAACALAALVDHSRQ